MMAERPALCHVHETRSQVFDTVLAATGRKADVEELGLENLGVALSDEGKVCYYAYRGSS